jgi:hypothetical protein
MICTLAHRSTCRRGGSGSCGPPRRSENADGRWRVPATTGDDHFTAAALPRGFPAPAQLSESIAFGLRAPMHSALRMNSDNRSNDSQRPARGPPPYGRAVLAASVMPARRTSSLLAVRSAPGAGQRLQTVMLFKTRLSTFDMSRAQCPDSFVFRRNYPKYMCGNIGGNSVVNGPGFRGGHLVKVNATEVAGSALAGQVRQATAAQISLPSLGARQCHGAEEIDSSRAPSANSVLTL